MSKDSFLFDVVYKGLIIPCKCTPSIEGGNMIRFEFYSNLVSSTGYRSHFYFKEEFLCSYPNLIEGYISCATDFLPGLIDQRFLQEPNILEDLLTLTLS